MRPKVRPSIIGIFCEDIRVEKNDSATIVGIFPDNLLVSKLPGMMPKLSIYARGRFPVERPPATFALRLEFPWEQQPLVLGVVELNKIGNEIKAAKEAGSDTIGLISMSTFSPFPVQKAGRIQAIVSTGKEEWLVASLNFIVGESPLPPQPVAAPTTKAIRPTQTKARQKKRRKHRL